MHLESQGALHLLNAGNQGHQMQTGTLASQEKMDPTGRCPISLSVLSHSTWDHKQANHPSHLDSTKPIPTSFPGKCNGLLCTGIYYHTYPQRSVSVHYSVDVNEPHHSQSNQILVLTPQTDSILRFLLKASHPPAHPLPQNISENWKGEPGMLPPPRIICPILLWLGG